MNVKPGSVLCFFLAFLLWAAAMLQGFSYSESSRPWTTADSIADIVLTPALPFRLFFDPFAFSAVPFWALTLYAAAALATMPFRAAFAGRWPRIWLRALVAAIVGGIMGFSLSYAVWFFTVADLSQWERRLVAIRIGAVLFGAGAGMIWAWFVAKRGGKRAAEPKDSPQVNPR
jgi:predicted Na+-dependent transporter